MTQLSEVNTNGDRGFDFDYEYSIWLEIDKTYEQLDRIIEKVLYPMKVMDREFEIGPIGGTYILNNSIAPEYPGVPDGQYKFRIMVDTPGYIPWSGFARQFALSLTEGIRGTLNSKYLVTNSENVFVMYSGTNLPIYYNPTYYSWKTGELNGFKRKNSIEVATIQGNESHR